MEALTLLQFLSDHWPVITVLFVLFIIFLIAKNGRDFLRQVNHYKDTQGQEEARQRRIIENRKIEHSEEARRRRR